MNSWQELIDYVYGEIDTLPFYQNKKPNMNNILALANESLLGLTIDYLSFSNSNEFENLSIMDYPNDCTEVFQIMLNGDIVRRCDNYEYEQIVEDEELSYKLGEYKIIFSEPITCDAGDLEIIGKGKFDMYTKDPNDNRVFKLLPVEFHYIPAYWILHRLYLRAGNQNMATYYLSMYKELHQNYDWSLVVRRTKEASFDPMGDWNRRHSNIYKTKEYGIYDKVLYEVTTVPSLTPAQISDQINQAVTTLGNDVYRKSEVDAKDATVLQNAKDYTYSKQAISNKDNGILSNAQSYTDEQVGDIEDAIEELLE